MKRLLAIMMSVVLLVGLAGCGKQPSTGDDGGGRYSAEEKEIIQILEDTYFDVGVEPFNGMTFGEVMDDLVKKNSDNEVTYKVNGNIYDLNSFKGRIKNFDQSKYDYISALIGYDFGGDYITMDISAKNSEGELIGNQFKDYKICDKELSSSGSLDKLYFVNYVTDESIKFDNVQFYKYKINDFADSTLNAVPNLKL